MHVKKIEFRNFRCFRRNSFPLNPFTVLVGPNNSGKSTLIEGLKLVSIVAQRAPASNFVLPDEDLGLEEVQPGITPSLDGIDFREANVTYRYASPPAEIVATFSNGAKIQLHIGRDRYVFANLVDPSGAAVTTKAAARALRLPGFWVMDNGAPLEEKEQLRDEKYVRKHQLTKLAPRHFRNQLLMSPEHFPRFQEIAREWNGLRVERPKQEYADGTMQLFLDATDRGFTAEVSWMGAGLQLWLQTAWLLARAQSNSIVVLDEPETYMHPDMQRRLLTLLRRGTYEQVIISTHSPELISDARPTELLPVNKGSARASFASSIPEAQQVINRVGSRYNIELARLVGSRKLLLLEGRDDKEYLGLLYEALFPAAEGQLDLIPSLPIGGWDGFDAATQFAAALCQQQKNMRVYCFLDRDHHAMEEIDKRLERASDRKVHLHVWELKEIESYLLVASAIARHLNRAGCDVAESKVEEWLLQESDLLEDATFDLISTAWLKRNKAKSVAAANHHARETLQANWGSLAGRLRLVPGKTLLQAISRRAHDEYGRGVSGSEIARAMHPDDMAPEMKRVLRAIEAGTALE